MGVAGVAHHAAAFREHGAQFRVAEGDGENDHHADYPGDDGGWAGDLGGVGGAEQPAGADDGAQAGQHQGDGADMAGVLLCQRYLLSENPTAR